MVSGSFTVSCISIPLINTWSDGLDYITISHIAISGFLMSIIFDMSNSRSPKLQQGLESTVQIKPLIWRLMLHRDFEKLRNPVPLTLQSVNLRSFPTCPSWWWTVHLLSGFCEPLFSLLYFKRRAGSPWSIDGRIPRLDRTPEIYPPL